MNQSGSRVMVTCIESLQCDSMFLEIEIARLVLLATLRQDAINLRSVKSLIFFSSPFT
jgi:hypothetical protein